MLRLTLLVSAIASATFAGTLAFAPAVMEMGQQVLAGEVESTTTISVVADPIRQCGPLAKIVDALRNGRECP
jgi:hypothetical protein